MAYFYEFELILAGIIQARFVCTPDSNKAVVSIGRSEPPIGELETINSSLKALSFLVVDNEKLTKEHWTTHGNFDCHLCWFYICDCNWN